MVEDRGIRYGEVRATDGAIWGRHDRWVLEGKIWIKAADWPEAEKHGWEWTATDDPLVCVRRRVSKRAVAIQQTAREMPIWNAVCSFAYKGEDEEGYSIHYRALVEDAVTSAVAWVENRQRELPDHFGKLLALKVFAFSPMPISEDGSLEASTSFWRYEWKCDHSKALPRRPS